MCVLTSRYYNTTLHKFILTELFLRNIANNLGCLRVTLFDLLMLAYHFYISLEEHTKSFIIYMLHDASISHCISLILFFTFLYKTQFVEKTRFWSFIYYIAYTYIRNTLHNVFEIENLEIAACWRVIAQINNNYS